MEYVQLVGAESVSQAGKNIAGAAETISQNLQWNSEIIRDLITELREMRALISELKEQLGKGGA